MAPDYAPWLRLFWSGQLLELERQLLPGEGLPNDEDIERLLFVGPPGERVACQHLRGAELEKALGPKTKAAEQTLVLLAWLDSAALRESVGEFLGVAG